MSREERQALLHEGSGSAVMSAYVEITFDNSDNRFPTGNKQVVIRRTIGLKKDEYSVDKKSSSKSDVMNLLESAGFSRSNPYYIVPQGRVTALTNAKDTERLNLLKEVAGTKVYESRRIESLKVMNETTAKREKITEYLSFIDERLVELEAEMKELREYTEKDREKRIMDFTIFDRELHEINAAVDELELERAHLINQTEERMIAFGCLEDRQTSLEKEISDMRLRTEYLELEKTQLEQDLQEMVKSRAHIELKLQDLETNKDNLVEAQRNQQSSLSSLEKVILDKEQQLASLLPQYNSINAHEQELKTQVSDLEAKQQRLQLKLGRSAKFSSKSDQDLWLQNEIEAIDHTLKDRIMALEDLKNDIEDLKNQKRETTKSIEDLRATLDLQADQYKRLKQEESQIQLARDQLMDERKLLWRDESKIEFALDKSNEELDSAERAVSETMSRDMSLGLAAVRHIADKLDLPGVYGTLSDLIDIDDKFKLALEVTAGNSLFHVVVDTDETASKVMERLTREKSGRATFMPLNRLTPPQYQYPDTNDAIPLVKKIKYDSRFEPAILQVFGRTLVCVNMEAGQQYSHSHNLNAITLQGDRIDNKGIVTGGFHDTRKSRMDSVKSLKAIKEELTEKESQATTIKSLIKQKDRQITEAIDKVNKIRNQVQETSLSVDEINDKLRTLVMQETQLNDLLISKSSAFNELESNIKALGDEKDSYKKDLQTPFNHSLTTEEQNDLYSIKKELPGLKEKLISSSTQRIELERQKSLIETELQQNLYVRRDQLRYQNIELEEDNQSNEKLLQDQIKKLTLNINDITSRMTAIENDVEEISANKQAKEEELSQAKDEIRRAGLLIDKDQNKAERGVNKRTILLKRKDELQSKIRELGVLPEDAFTKYRKISSQDIVKRLQKIGESLKKFAHVNKKAVEQFNNFTRERESLLERQQELEKSQKSIEELIETLDQRKDEAIERTFKQVSKGFAEIFEKLVPTGVGKLVMQRRADVEEDEGTLTGVPGSNSLDESVNRSEVENYIGVSIRVSFNSKKDEQQRIEQLSGGQKSLCALALIFAIQQCDPAPFYLFDEIDANLDTQYRTAVAALIKELSTNGQFICTTFRPEMLHVANQFYGVLFNNKMSTIVSISQEDATGFIEGQKAT